MIGSVARLLRLPERPDRLEALEARVADLERRAAGPPAAPAPASDPFYRAFEDRFRGSREEIRGRLAEYAKIVARHRARLPEADRPGFLAVDLGCGRGELLELLAAREVRAEGVDSDAGQTADARAAGLRIIAADLIEDMAGRPAGCVDVVTALHVLEHLPFPAVRRLLGEILRVLRPGGLFILETPNPENLMVGALKFHMDPTHVTPLPPELMEFTLEQAGFTEIQVARLSPDPLLDPARDAGTAPDVASLLYGPRDYAIRARKP